MQTDDVEGLGSNGTGRAEDDDATGEFSKLEWHLAILLQLRGRADRFGGSRRVAGRSSCQNDRERAHITYLEDPVASTSLEKHEAEHSAGHGDQEHDHEHGPAELANVSHAQVVSYNPDAPSEEWGWHGSWRQFAPKGSRMLLWLFTASIFLMLFGNHVSHTEDWFLVLSGVLMAYWLLKHEVRLRAERKRRP